MFSNVDQIAFITRLDMRYDNRDSRYCVLLPKIANSVPATLLVDYVKCRFQPWLILSDLTDKRWQVSLKLLTASH